jgi:rSAM/selenodomain-associated transferase 1
MDAIVIMAREPKPNQVKTRLIPQLDPETAAKLYYNFLLDRIDQVDEIKGPRPFVAFTPESAKAFFNTLVPPEFNLIPQTGADLGERLTNVSIRLFDHGFKKVVIMDSDSPNLPSKFIREAFERLDSEEVVIGSCEDGGYYLIGLKESMPSLFKDIPWSTPRVTEVTKERASKQGVAISMLDKWYDVDTNKDLLQLKRDLDSDFKEEKGAFFCKNTYQFLSQILK